MEIARNEREECSTDERSSRKESSDFSRQIPTAPDLEPMSNVVEANFSIPERVERVQPTTWRKIWMRMRSKYRRMDEESFNQTNQESTNQIIPNYIPNGDIFSDEKSRNQLLRKLYGLFIGQLTWLTCLCALFYYSPHLRHIFRKTFADKIFLKSLFGAPLGVISIVLFFFQSLRRKYSLICFLLLNAVLSSLICYLMAYQRDNLFVLFEMATADGCFALAGLSNLLIPKFNMKRRYQSLFFPLVMTSLQGVQPLLMNRNFGSTWYKNLIFVSAASYVGYNLNSVMNNQNLALKKEEATFAFTQSFINFNPATSIEKLFKRQQPTFQRI